MNAGIASLVLRSSPTCCSILRAASQLAHVHSSSAHLQSSSGSTDTMLSRAHKEYEANASSQRNGLAKQLFPSSSPSANTDIREQFKKPGSADPAASSARNGNNDRSSPAWNRPGPQRGSGHRSLASLYGNSDSFRHESSGIIDLTGSGPSEKSKQEVFFAEDDFSDDENLDLDFEAPTSLPPMPKKLEPAAKENMPPPPTPTQNMEWSSSPPSHWHLPKPQRTESGASNKTEPSLKRHSSGENDSFDAPLPKKRVLPWKSDLSEQEDTQPVAKTPGHSSRKDFLDPTASAIKEQKRQLKNGRQPQKLESSVETSNEEAQQVPEVVQTKVTPFSLSREQRHVLELVVEQNRSVFFTGPAGTGKSVLMRAIIDELKKKYSRDPERVAVTASTGLAACNIGGMTLHSFSGTFGFVNNDPLLYTNYPDRYRTWKGRRVGPGQESSPESQGQKSLAESKMSHHR